MLEIARTVWQWRRVVRTLAWRELRARYAGSALGLAWAVLEPVVQFALYLAVFGLLLGTRFAEGGSVGSFALYLISGLVPFQAVQEVAVRCSSLARANAQLLRHIGVPFEALAAASVLAISLRYGVMLVLVLAIAAAAGSLAVSGLPWLLAGLVLLLALQIGTALVVAPAGAYLPDLTQVVGTAGTVAFFATPIVYPESILPRWAAVLVELNPMTGLVSLVRAPILGSAPGTGRTAVVVVAAAALLALGSRLFRARARAVRDLV